MEIHYDKIGRMKYHPDFHPNNGTFWTEEDMEYLCKFAEVDHVKTISMALGRTEMTVSEKLSMLRKTGRYEHYKNLNKHW